MDEVRSFYQDLYQARTMNLDYSEIIEALGLQAIKLLYNILKSK